MSTARGRTVALAGCTALVVLAGCSSATSSPAPSTSSAKAGCPTPLPSPTMTIKPASIHLNVWNASGKDHFASDIAEELRYRGFRVIAEGNDPNPDDQPVPGWARIRFGPGGKQIALTLAAQVQNAQLSQDDRPDPSVDLVLGSKFAMMPVPPPPASTVTVNVYNTTFKAGLAGTVADGLRARGFKTADIGNDPQKAFLPDDVVLVRYGKHGDAAARRAAAQFSSAKLSYDARRTDQTLDVVLGNKYTELVPTAQATPKPFQVPTPSGC